MRHPLHTRDGVSHEYRAVYNDATDRIEAVAVAAKTASFDSRDANRDSYTVEILVLHQIPPRHFSSTGDGQMTTSPRRATISATSGPGAGTVTTTRQSRSVSAVIVSSMTRSEP